MAEEDWRVAERKHLGSRLKGARHNAGFTLDQVAEELRKQGFDVGSKAAVGHWESGRNLPDILVLRALAKLYDQPLDALAWESALSFEAMQFAAEFENLSAEKKRTLRAIWVAFITSGNDAAHLPIAPAHHTEKSAP